MNQKAAPPLSEQTARYQPVAAREHVPVPVTDPAMRAARETVMASSAWIRPLQQEMARVIVGQKHLLDRLLIALLTNGHVLLEGVPWLGENARIEDLGGLH